MGRQFSRFAGRAPLASLNGAPLAFSKCASGVFSSKSKIEMTQKEKAALERPQVRVDAERLEGIHGHRLLPGGPSQRLSNFSSVCVCVSRNSKQRRAALCEGSK